MEPGFVVISVKPPTRERLRGAKLYSRETYDELLNRILDEREVTPRPT